MGKQFRGNIGRFTHGREPHTPFPGCVHVFRRSSVGVVGGSKLNLSDYETGE